VIADEEKATIMSNVNRGVDINFYFDEKEELRIYRSSCNFENDSFDSK
jgi:hypothetical protein